MISVEGNVRNVEVSVKLLAQTISAMLVMQGSSIFSFTRPSFPKIDEVVVACTTRTATQTAQQHKPHNHTNRTATQTAQHTAKWQQPPSKQFVACFEFNM
jgi:hypothetical protein